MRKISFLCLALALALGVFTACGSTTKAADTTTKTEAKVEEKTESKGQMRDIVLTIGGKSFEAQIEENADSKQLLAKLPMDISMSQLGSGNFIYGGNFTPPKSNYQKNFSKGEIALCHSDYILVFYGNHPSSHEGEYRPIGKITSNLDQLDSISSGGRLHMELKK